MIIQALNELGITSEFCVDANVNTEEHYLRTYRDLTNQNRFFEWSVVSAKIAELQAQYEANEYQRQRAAAYPSWQDQLDKIYHEGIDAWKAEIQAIKDQYPKPDGA